MFSHIAFPPLGYVMHMSLPPEFGPLDPTHNAMADISYFKNFGWGQRITIELTLPIYRPIGPEKFYGVED